MAAPVPSCLLRGDAPHAPPVSGRKERNGLRFIPLREAPRMKTRGASPFLGHGLGCRKRRDVIHLRIVREMTRIRPMIEWWNIRCSGHHTGDGQGERAIAETRQRGIRLQGRIDVTRERGTRQAVRRVGGWPRIGMNHEGTAAGATGEDKSERRYESPRASTGKD
jgi:hypothetical protein